MHDYQSYASGLCTLLKQKHHMYHENAFLAGGLCNFVDFYAFDLRPFLSVVAGLRRSFRLSRKDRQGSSGEGSDPGDSDYLTYEEVTRYQQKPHERPRLVVLIGEPQCHLVAVIRVTPVLERQSGFICFCLVKVLLERE